MTFCCDTSIARLRGLDRLRVQAGGRPPVDGLGWTKPVSGIKVKAFCELTGAKYTWQTSDSSASASWANPWRLNLIKGGHKLFLNSRSGVPPELTAAGGTACASAKEVAQKSDIIIIMVPDTPDVENVLFGANGVADGLAQRQDRRRHELDFADRNQEVRANASTSSAANTSTRRCRAARSARRTRAHDHGRRAADRRSTR